MLRAACATRHLFCKRSFASAVDSQRRSVREIEIPVPWGKVAGKLWGDDNQQPILALHGWQDNAGSFNKLAPLLENYSILAIDWPGHGHSSWLPPGMMYTELIYISVISRIKRHFGWEHLKLMGHSLGGMISFTYATLFNSEVKFVICMDQIKFPVYDTNSYNSMLREIFQKFMEVEHLQESSAPSYSEEEAIRRWKKATDESIDDDACKELIIRGTKKKADGTLSFSRDPRLKNPAIHLISHTQECYKDMAKEIKNPYLAMKATDSPYFDEKENVFEIVNILKENSSDFIYQRVTGRHHFHMTNPRGVAEVVKPFLEKHYN